MTNQTSPQKRYLIGIDFDETLFHTFSPSPNGIDVKKAYKLALDKIFVPGTGEWFFELFGLQNKTPSEVVSQILRWDEEKIDQAYQFYQSEGKNGYPISKYENGELSWNKDSPEKTITQMFVGEKLKTLLTEIGQMDESGNPWPQPCEGVLDFFKTVQRVKQESLPIDIAIISSGHEAFIKRTLDVWRVPYPEVLVTEDDIRPRRFPIEEDRRFKPGTFPMALAHQAWLKQQGMLLRDSRVVEVGRESKKRIMYVGDSPEKDIGMAVHSRLSHSHLYPFTPFQAISDVLVEKSHLFDGRPLSQILRTDENRIETDILLPDNLGPRYRGKEGLR